MAVNCPEAALKLFMGATITVVLILWLPDQKHPAVSHSETMLNGRLESRSIAGQPYHLFILPLT